jgi:hypothetical protein
VQSFALREAILSAPIMMSLRLSAAGFADVEVQERPRWRACERAMWETAVASTLAATPRSAPSATRACAPWTPSPAPPRHGCRDRPLTVLPRLIYVKTPAPDREPRLAQLLARIRDEGGVSYQHFSDPAELQQLVENDLAVPGGRVGRLSITQAWRAAAWLAGNLSDEQLLAQNILFFAATGKNPAGAAFVHIGGSRVWVRQKP